MKDIIIFGSGGLGREVQWLIERINSQKQEWNLLGYVDDEIAVGTEIDGYSVLGNTEYLLNYRKTLNIVCAVGNAKMKRQIIQRLKQNNLLLFPVLIDPSTLLSNRCQLGEGTVICAGCVLTVDLKLGDFVTVNPNTTIGHDAIIENYVTIYPSVNVSGMVRIKEAAEIGVGTQIIQGKVVGRSTIVGAGSVVVKDLPDQCTAVGSPARPIKFHAE